MQYLPEPRWLTVAAADLVHSSAWRHFIRTGKDLKCKSAEHASCPVAPLLPTQQAQGCCSSQVDVKSTCDISYSGDAGKRLPLLTAELMVTPDGTTFCYSTPPDLIHSKALALFDRALQKLQVGLGCWGNSKWLPDA
jgi:hypothetical protein